MFWIPGDYRAELLDSARKLAFVEAGDTEAEERFQMVRKPRQHAFKRLARALRVGPRQQHGAKDEIDLRRVGRQLVGTQQDGFSLAVPPHGTKGRAIFEKCRREGRKLSGGALEPRQRLL